MGPTERRGHDAQASETTGTWAPTSAHIWSATLASVAVLIMVRGSSAPAEPLRPLTCPARCATCCHESAVSRSAKRPSPHALACLCVSCLTAGEQPTELGPAHPSAPGDERGQLGHGRYFRGRLTATGLHCAGTLCAHQRQPLLSPRDLLYFMCMVDPRERTGGGVRECGVGGRRWLRECDEQLIF